MMEYREFVEELMAEIKEETGLKAEFHEADEKMPQDSIWVYMSEDDGSSNIVRLFTAESYNWWTQRKTTFPAIIRGVKKSVENFDSMCVPDKLKKLKDYEQVKENLFIRLINFEKNKTELEKAFYKRNGDIALTLYMKIADEDGTMTSLKVPLKCVERWDLEKEDVFMAALKNTVSMMPPKVYDMMKMLLNPEYDGEDIDDPDYIPFQDTMGNCLSTGQKTNGAVAIFYPGVARLFCDKINTDGLYLVFTSIHEVMVHNARMIEPEDLASVLDDTIKESTPEDDVLTKHIYYYNAETDRIIMVE